MSATAADPAPPAPAAPPPPPLRVLHCYAGNLFGGIETLLVTLSRCGHLAPGLRHEFALCFEGRLARELRDAGAVLHDLGPVRFSRPWTVLRARRRLRRLLAEGRHDVAVLHDCWPHVLAAPAARRAGLGLAFWAHSAPGGGHWLERLARRTRPDRAIANSRFMAGLVPRLFPSGPAPDLLYCPVAPPDPGDRVASRAEARRALGTPGDAAVVLLASRLAALKGHAQLVEALGLLAGRPGWVAWIAGGPQRAEDRAYLDRLRARAAELGVADRVAFLGERADVPRLMDAADLLCQPNVGPETFGIAFVEALYRGLPVVTTDLGGGAEVVTADCGVLVPPGDPVALAGALGALLDDPTARARLAAAAPARAAALCDPAAALGALRTILDGARAAAGARGRRP